jgi:Ala-tRNA(Pro) deacylase
MSDQALNTSPAAASRVLPTSPDALLLILQQLGVTYQIHHHPPIFTVAEGVHLKQSIPGLHCRNLFVRDKKGVMFLVVVGNDTAVDLKALADRLGCGRLSFGSPDRLWTYLGITPGSVCPFCVINDTGHEVQIVLDAAMMQADTVCYHPLDNAMTIALKPSDLLRFCAHTGHTPKILDLSGAAPT